LIAKTCFEFEDALLGLLPLRANTLTAENLIWKIESNLKMLMNYVNFEIKQNIYRDDQVLTALI
jgi:hypothetical protein